ncbi:hypothetical protein FW754_15330 [Acinetobacter sp. 1207_04]|uniref:hypothetical protein n=1 Tax=Acinetobacter sp. 1207_04 TaxID=2604449 RepID=UPI004059812B
MNANELYENLKNIGKPLIHVESIEATMHMNIPVEEIDKYIEIIGVNFLLVEILRFDFSDVFSQKNKRYIAEYIIENKADEKLILSIKEKKPSDIGMVSIGFNLNGCILALTHTDKWMEHLIHLIEYISNKEESEDNYNYWEEQNKIKEQKKLEKENMIRKVEELTNSDIFKKLKTKSEMLVYWESNISDIYNTLSRSFMEKMAGKYITIKRNS